MRYAKHLLTNNPTYSSCSLQNDAMMRMKINSWMRCVALFVNARCGAISSECLVEGPSVRRATGRRYPASRKRPPSAPCYQQARKAECCRPSTLSPKSFSHGRSPQKPRARFARCATDPQAEKSHIEPHQIRPSGSEISRKRNHQSELQARMHIA